MVILKKPGVFGDQKGDVTINKANFPKNNLSVLHLGYNFNFKSRRLCNLYRLCNFRPVDSRKNCPDLDNYCLKENEVILYVPLYNTEHGYFRDAKKWLAYIMVQGDSNKTFFSYWYDEERSKIHFQIFFKVLLLKNMQKC